MSDLRTIVQNYIGVKPVDLGCDSWAGMQDNMVKNIESSSEFRQLLEQRDELLSGMHKIIELSNKKCYDAGDVADVIGGSEEIAKQLIQKIE